MASATDGGAVQARAEASTAPSPEDRARENLLAKLEEYPTLTILGETVRCKGRPSRRVAALLRKAMLTGINVVQLENSNIGELMAATLDALSEALAELLDIPPEQGALLLMKAGGEKTELASEIMLLYGIAGDKVVQAFSGGLGPDDPT